jgi:acyl dehydratase
MKTVRAAELANLVGKDLGAGDWLAIDQSRIDAFADVTLDHQFIHLDPKKAAHTPFGGTVAHGFLTLSLLPHLQQSLPDSIVPDGIKMGMNYGFDELRFLAPVRSGKRVRACGKLIDVSDKDGGRYLLKTEVTVEIEGED